MFTTIFKRIVVDPITKPISAKKLIRTSFIVNASLLSTYYFQTSAVLIISKRLFTLIRMQYFNGMQTVKTFMMFNRGLLILFFFWWGLGGGGVMGASWKDRDFPEWCIRVLGKLFNGKRKVHFINRRNTAYHFLPTIAARNYCGQIFI